MGPVSRSLSLAGRFPSLVSVDFKNIFKLNAQEGSQGLEQAQPGWDAGTYYVHAAQKQGTRSLLTCCLPTHSERPFPRSFHATWDTGDQGLVTDHQRYGSQSLSVD